MTADGPDPNWKNSSEFRIRNPELFRQAFTHTSFAHERRDGDAPDHNERLEFLGDAVLELLVSEHLYHRYPGKNEGDLTRMRARVVCEPSLAQFAEELGFGQLVRLGKGEEMTGGRRRPALLADLFEAFVGALYLDQGWRERGGSSRRSSLPESTKLGCPGSSTPKRVFRRLSSRSGPVP